MVRVVIEWVGESSAIVVRVSDAVCGIKNQGV